MGLTEPVPQNQVDAGAPSPGQDNGAPAEKVQAAPEMPGAAQIVKGDQVNGDKIYGDKVTGDKFIAGNVSGVGIAIGSGNVINVNYAPIQLQAPLRLVFQPLIEDRTRLFGGRQEALNQIARFIEIQAGGYLMLTAPAGFGKTALLAELVSRTPEAFAYHFFNPAYAPSSLSEDFFLRNVVQQIAEWHGQSGRLPERVPDLAALYQDMLGKPLAKTQVLVLDGIDEVQSWSIKPYLKRRLPERLHLIIAAREVGRDWVQELDLPDDRTQRVELGGLTRQDVAGALGAAGVHAHLFADNAELLTQVMRVASDPAEPTREADPFYVRLLAEDAEQGRLSAATLAEQPTGLSAYLDTWWQEIRQLAGEEPARDLFGTLTAAFGPLTRADLEAMNPSLTDAWAADLFNEVLNKVHRYVISDAAHGYTLVHARLRQYMRLKIRIESYREKLFVFCTNWFQHHSNYVLDHFTEQLAAAGSRSGILLAFLPRFEFAEAMTARLQIGGLLENLRASIEFARASGTEMTLLDSLEQVLRREMHNLQAWDASVAPNLMAQQVYNRATAMGLTELAASAAARLRALGKPYLELLWSMPGAIPEELLETAPRLLLLRTVALTPYGRLPLAVPDLDTLAQTQDSESSALQVRLMPAGTFPLLDVQVAVGKPRRAWTLRVAEGETDPEGEGTVLTQLSVDTVEAGGTVIGIRANGSMGDPRKGDSRVHILRAQLHIKELKPRSQLLGLDIERTYITRQEVFAREWENFVTRRLVALSRDGHHIAIADPKGTCKILDAASGELVSLWRAKNELVTSLDLAQGGRRVVVGTFRGALHVYDAVTGLEEYALEGHSGPVACVVATADGRNWISGSADRTVKVWDAESGKEQMTLAGHEDAVLAVAVTPDDAHVVSASADTTLRKWDLHTGEQEFVLRGHTERVDLVSVMNNGKQAISCDVADTWRIWDLISGQELQAFDEKEPFDLVPGVNGRYLVGTACWDSTIRLWDTSAFVQMRAARSLVPALQVGIGSVAGESVSVASAPDQTMFVAADSADRVYCFRYREVSP